MIKVSRRAHRYEDRAGDPLDGLVNLFDLGIVLSLAFLLAALASLHLDRAVTTSGLTPTSEPSDAVTIRPGETTGPVPSDGASVIGSGTRVGEVYRLSDGRLVYVVPSAAAGDGAQPTGQPTGQPTAGPTP